MYSFFDNVQKEFSCLVYHSPLFITINDKLYLIEKEKKKDQRPDSLDSDSSEFIEEESKRKK